MRLVRLLRPGLAARAVLLVLLTVSPVVIIGAVWTYRDTADDLRNDFANSVAGRFARDVDLVSEALPSASTGSEVAAARDALNSSADYAEFALVPATGATTVTMCFTDQTQCVPTPLTDILRQAIRGVYTGGYLDSGLYVQSGPIYLAGASDPSFTFVEWFQQIQFTDHLPALRHRLTVLAFVTIATAVGAALLGALLLDLRLAWVSRGAAQIERGEFDARLAVRGYTGAASVARSVNAMADRMSDTVRDLHESQTLQQRFVADVSHELRTPLAAVLAAGEGLDSDDAQVRDRSIDLVRAQTRRLVTLVGDLLEMSRFDAGQNAMQTEAIDVTEVARDVVRTVAPEADVRITTLGDTTAEVDVRRVHTILRNLVANAFQHGEPPVDIVVDGHAANELAVTVADDGPGVPSFLVPVIFERFARADAARGSEGEHSGLGLAIATENARLHGAVITLAATGRTAFTLRLPRRLA